MTLAIDRWELAKASVTDATEALGAALHRQKHPSRLLDGFGCSCYYKAEALTEWLAEMGYEVALIPVAMKAAAE